MKKFLSLLLALAMLLSLMAFASAEEADTRPRTIVTTDLENDDIDSLLHVLLYANDIDIAAIIATSSCHHWTGDGVHTQREVGEEGVDYKPTNDEGWSPDIMEWRPQDLDWLFDTILNDYGAVWPNLVKHDSRYPSPGELMERTRIGNVEFESDMRFSTDGSNYIKSILLDDDTRPVYVQAWGGSNSLARALLDIEEEFKDNADWDAIYKKVSEKCILISWGDQDYTYRNYISVSWPDVVHLYCVTGGIGYHISRSAPAPYRYYFEPEWLMENIKFNHGPLMAKYLLFGDGIYYNGELPWNQFGSLEAVNMEQSWLKNDWKRYEFISEGDSPCWMYLIPVGLRGMENPSYGSWGGRIDPNATNGFRAAISEFNPTTGKMSGGYSVHRWFPAFMNDWAARADWCVTDYEDANHQPVVWTTTEDATLARGETIELNGFAEDPDGDNLHYNWFVYTDACVYSGAYLPYLDVWAHDVASTTFTVPNDAAEGDYFNLVLEVTDDGEPALTRYAQVIITVDAVPEGGNNDGSSGGSGF